MASPGGQPQQHTQCKVYPTPCDRSREVAGRGLARGESLGEGVVCGLWNGYLGAWPRTRQFHSLQTIHCLEGGWFPVVCNVYLGVWPRARYLCTREPNQVGAP